jgi:hypothetical protein
MQAVLGTINFFISLGHMKRFKTCLSLQMPLQISLSREFGDGPYLMSSLQSVFGISVGFGLRGLTGQQNASGGYEVICS